MSYFYTVILIPATGSEAALQSGASAAEEDVVGRSRPTFVVVVYRGRRTVSLNVSLCAKSSSLHPDCRWEINQNNLTFSQTTTLNLPL